MIVPVTMFPGPEDLQAPSLGDEIDEINTEAPPTVDANNNVVDVDDFEFGSGPRPNINDRRREFGDKLARARLTHRQMQRNMLGQIRQDLRTSLGKID